MAALGVGSGAQPGARSDYGNDQKALLNTYIHNYFVHEGHYDLAKTIRGSKMALNQKKLREENGNNKQVNGTDESMDTDAKDGMRNGADGNGNNQLGDTFLLDYWFIFWDMWNASKRPADKSTGNAAEAYWDVHKRTGKLPPQQQQQMQQMMVPNSFAMGGRNPMIPAQNYNLQRAAMVNNGRNMQPGPLLRQQPGQVMGAQNMGAMGMQVDGSDVDMNGQQRPQSPMSGGENAPSPKRQRLDGAQFNNQQMNTPGRNPMVGGLPNGAAGNAEAMRMQDPKGPSPAHMQMNQVMRNNQNLYSQQLAQSTKGMINGGAFGNGIPNGVANGIAQVSPMMSNEPGMDQQFMNNQRQNLGNGNGALADYQMQLMLLEQQNKKRLMVARQENGQGGQPNLMGQNGFGAQAMSPRGSRTGHSPNGTDRQRQTPRMGQGSPLPDGSMPPNTGSPVPPNFGDPSQMNLNQHFNPHANGGMMRPPGPNGMNGPEVPLNAQHLDMLHRTGGRLPNGPWANGPMSGPMGPQAGGPQQNPGDNSQQRGNMPPPQAPTAAGNNGRSQPSPTQQNAAPPTPSQSNKNTKKKDGKETKKKNNKKAQSTTGATPNADSERAPTPTPQTPITPVNADSHVIKGQQPNQASAASNQTTTSTNASTQPGLPTAPDNNSNMSNAPFGSLDTDVFNINDLQTMDNSDVLDGFDFDTFLETSALGAEFGDFSMSGDVVEAGTGDGN